MNMESYLKQRFCKDCGIPINVFEEPYFSERLILFSCYYQSVHKFNLYSLMLQEFKNKQDYFEYYKKVKESAMDYILSTDGYKEFNKMDMTEISETIKKVAIQSSSVYKDTNDGKSFISIDMEKANFSSLRFFSADIFGGAKTWNEFMAKFTDYPHIKNSKYIRQVILGKCNPKRHITYERFLMANLASMLMEEYEEYIECMTNDEIILSTYNNKVTTDGVNEIVEKYKEQYDIPLKVERFTLHNMEHLGFFKSFDDGRPNEFKCIDADYMPMVLRNDIKEQLHENDFIVNHGGTLAKLVDVPEPIAKYLFNLKGEKYDEIK